MGIAKINKTIKSTRERTWAAFTNFEQAAKKIRGIEQIEILERGDEQGIGLRFRETRRFGKRLHTEELEVTHAQAPAALCIESNACGGRFKSSFQFTPSGESTDVSVELSFKPLSLMAKICTPIKGLLLGSCVKAMQADLDDLQRAIEGE